MRRSGWTRSCVRVRGGVRRDLGGYGIAGRDGILRGSLFDPFICINSDTFAACREGYLWGVWLSSLLNNGGWSPRRRPLRRGCLGLICRGWWLTGRWSRRLVRFACIG